MFQPFYLLSCPPVCAFKDLDIVFVLWKPKLHTIFKFGQHQHLNIIKRMISLDHWAMLCSMYQKMQFGLLASRAHCWFMLQLLSIKTSRCLSFELLSSHSSSSLYPCLALLRPRCRTRLCSSFHCQSFSATNYQDHFEKRLAPPKSQQQFPCSIVSKPAGDALHSFI